MSVIAQIKAMRDEAQREKREMPLASWDGARFAALGGQVGMANRVLALLDDCIVVPKKDVLAEVEGWLPSTVLPGKEHILWSFMTKKMEPTDRHVRVLILQGESCPHCAKPLVKEVVCPDPREGTSHYVCKECGGTV